MNTVSGVQLIRGHRYLFTEMCPNTFYERQYRANYTSVIEGFLVTKYNEKKEPEHFEHTIFTPVQWIVKVESLEDILEGKTILPDDVLRIIDKYN
jgi:hypothetical protein